MLKPKSLSIAVKSYISLGWKEKKMTIATTVDFLGMHFESPQTQLFLIQVLEKKCLSNQHFCYLIKQLPITNFGQLDNQYK